MFKKFIVGFSFGIVLFSFTLKDIKWGEFVSSWTKINPFWIIPGLIIFTLGLLLKTKRWLLLLDEKKLSFNTIFSVLCIGYLVNNLLPARLGEVARIYLVGRREKVGVSKTTGTIVIEKLLDTFSLVLIFIVLFFLGPLAKLTSIPLVLGTSISKRWKERLQFFLGSFRILRNKNVLLLLLIISLVVWLLEGLWNYSLLHSFNINVPISTALFLAIVVNFGLFIPSPPGYLGVFHFLTTFALLQWGIDKSQALSYSVYQYTIEYLILTMLGIYSAIKLSFNPLKEKTWQKV